MAASNFWACMEHVFASEGGYVNHPRDPGGETNFGISKRTYPNEDIRGMTKDRAAAIYRRDFWDKVRGDALPPGVDLVAFDGAVNSGVSRGAKWVQLALGVVADGAIGPKTLAALAMADDRTTINVACDRRMSFLRGLKTWGDFGKGWTRRVSSVRATALAMAADAPTAPPVDHVPTVAPAEPSGGLWAALVAAVAKWLGKK